MIGSIPTAGAEDTMAKETKQAETPKRTKKEGPLTNTDKLKVARRVLAEMGDVDPSDQRDIMRALTVTVEHRALRRVLAILEPLSLADRFAVEKAVGSLVGTSDEPYPSVAP